MKLVIDVRLEYDHKPLTGQVIVEEWPIPRPEAKTNGNGKSQMTLLPEPPPIPWQQEPATSGQIGFLEQHGIPHTSGIRKGEASKLIDAYKMQNGTVRIQTFSTQEKKTGLPYFYGTPDIAPFPKKPVLEIPTGTEELMPWEQEEADKNKAVVQGTEKKHKRGGARPGAGRPKGSKTRKGDTI